MKSSACSRRLEAATDRILYRLSRLSFFAALFFVIAAAVAPSPHVRPKIGQQAPPFALLDQNRKRVSLADVAGTKVVLVFYRGYW
jgi:cytochrome oxidase Cu insertion factor (SCO1/SenC/PrrC family)